MTLPTRALPLLGRAALITGAQQGIGAAIAIEFASAGADVAINYLDDAAAAEAVAATVRAHGRRALVLHADIGVVGELRALVDQAAGGLGRLDVMVNNAAIYPRVDLLAMEEADWGHADRHQSQGHLFRDASRRPRDERGRGAGVDHQPVLPARCSARCAARTTRPARAASPRSPGPRRWNWRPHRIRVNAIAPGLTDTAQPRYGSTEAELAAMAQALPLGRMAIPSDIAQTAGFLASDASAMITGQILHVNAGSHMP